MSVALKMPSGSARKAGFKKALGWRVKLDFS